MDLEGFHEPVIASGWDGGSKRLRHAPGAMWHAHGGGPHEPVASVLSQRRTRVRRAGRKCTSMKADDGLHARRSAASRPRSRICALLFT